MDLQKLAEAMPGIATKLGELMVKDGLGMFQQLGLTFDDAMPSAGLSFTTRDGDRLRVTLAIEKPDDDDGEDFD
ncbi:hypothetical protein EBE87_26815 [Pseudoroseomonas wenyumeiae]|uniref:Uncharacterized protein n=1 Tax=Teichococcus wenyumeiae TaxID=2478470 RepID=A0A3A9JTS5_9PROT|nr:hypothetical protein [Pseudoroseomonas wenyumeiae]RKK02399.1 hypothetical protein D6Z83_19965 [Pseudoroseomonas wenyumeiae]RMI15207.1 hypothetical protein EBE87_26815 [Pseudoroseomonas wenyumeiae]